MEKVPEMNQKRNVEKPRLLTTSDQKKKRSEVKNISEVKQVTRSKKDRPASDFRGKNARGYFGDNAISVTVLTFFANIVGPTVVVLEYHLRKVTVSRKPARV